MAKKTASTPAHPTYAEMIKEAIVTLKERNGSSLAALKKFVGQKYKLPSGWDKKLSLYLKKLTADGKLTKVKGSWKLGEALKKAPSKAKKAVVGKVAKKAASKATAKKKDAKKPKSATKKAAAPAPKKSVAATPKSKATTSKATKSKTPSKAAKAAPSGGVKKPATKKKATKQTAKK